MKFETKKKDFNKILRDKFENVIKDDKWRDNKLPVTLNHAPNTTRAFSWYIYYKDPPNMSLIINKR